MSLLEQLFFVFNLIPVMGITILIVVNTFFFKRLNQFAASSQQPTVSVLIPARNEALNLPKLLPTLLAQSYANLEIIVLDDHSDDATLAIAQGFAALDSRLKVLSGGALLEGWLGKPNACRQLAQVATGEILIFTDADTLWQPDAVTQIVAALENADALSAWSEQLLSDNLARVVTPWATWSVLAFLPLWLVSNNKFPQVVTANGQLLAFRRSCFEAIGGFEFVNQSLLEDRDIAIRVKTFGFRFVLLNGVGSVKCQMYSSWSETFNGFVKGAFAAVGNSVGQMLVRFGLLAWLFVLPWFLLPFSSLAWWSVGLAFLGRFVSDRIFGFAPTLWLWQLFGHLAAIWITVVSWQRSKRGTLAWKGRLHQDGKPVSKP